MNNYGNIVRYSLPIHRKVICLCDLYLIAESAMHIRKIRWCKADKRVSSDVKLYIYIGLCLFLQITAVVLMGLIKLIKTTM